MTDPLPDQGTRGKWLALTAALLGWMFDGLEQGLFPLVARPALQDLLGGHASDDEIGKWNALATACYLVGAATGGVLFGWLGDRLGRVRAMTLSVLTYSVFSGLCGLAMSPVQIAGLRFLSSVGMGGEWSLGVALVMEIWPDKSRGFLAGLIGAAANVGYVLIGAIGKWLMSNLAAIGGWLESAGLSESQITWLTANSGWRLIFFVGIVPALLTFFIRLFVPESQAWERERTRGTTSHWSGRDLLGIAVGLVGIFAILCLWTPDLLRGLGLEEPPLAVKVAGSLVALGVATVGYLYPVIRFLARSAAAGKTVLAVGGTPISRMLLGACLGGVPLLGTWASIQWASTWAHKLTESQGQLASSAAISNTQMASAIGAVLGTIAGALLGDRLGRRKTYFLLCVGSLAASQFFFRFNTEVGPMFLISVFAAGMLTASFYGWLPLYLPELFSAGMRATGQGFSYNFGRILAAIGALQTGYLMKDVFKNDYASACSTMSFVYIVGMAIIWLAPETRGRRLPD